MDKYFYMTPATDNPAQLEPSWRHEYERVHRFTCGHIDFGARVSSVELSSLGDDAALSFIGPLDDALIRKDLFDALSPEILTGLTCGKVFLHGLGQIDRLVLYRGRDRVWIRSDTQSYCHHCPNCGQLIYNRLGSRCYLMRCNLPQSAVFAANGGGIILAETVYERIKGHKWPLVDVRYLPVRDDPLDGFPAQLETITPELERPWRPLR